ncbi:hypothetical protein M8C21_018260 [Ambrosia artemisiifolia]|uniref:Secreted protein n=1 Tax=Ambrosia artemisiifolia TaxID=4212 RepID=A0AAD5GFX1_AMBAR|nr:hypothetical protein M8C21_018260 [Ambrosia artemisiifolia]
MSTFSLSAHVFLSTQLSLSLLLQTLFSSCHRLHLRLLPPSSAFICYGHLLKTKKDRFDDGDEPNYHLRYRHCFVDSSPPS